MSIGVPFQIDWGGGTQRMKNVQGTVKILIKSDFSSDLTRFLAIIGGGGARALPKRYTQSYAPEHAL